jgi:hypothetical protein
MARFFARVGADTVVSKESEYLSLKEQWDRAESRIASARQTFMGDVPAFNQRLEEFPERLANKYLYKLKPFPGLQNSAAQ